MSSDVTDNPMRAEFEAPMTQEGYSAEMEGVAVNGFPRVYADPRIHAAWTTWKADIARQVAEAISDRAQAM